MKDEGRKGGRKEERRKEEDEEGVSQPGFEPGYFDYFGLEN